MDDKTLRDALLLWLIEAEPPKGWIKHMKAMTHRNRVERKFSRINIYRGLSFPNARNFINKSKGHLRLKKTQAESWTTDPSVAGEFIGRYDISVMISRVGVNPGSLIMYVPDMWKELNIAAHRNEIESEHSEGADHFENVEWMAEGQCELVTENQCLTCPLEDVEFISMGNKNPNNFYYVNDSLKKAGYVQEPKKIIGEPLNKPGHRELVFDMRKGNKYAIINLSSYFPDSYKRMKWKRRPNGCRGFYAPVV